jgi:diaminopimelate epimerase
MRFTKMHGAGNDYVYIDCFAQSVPRDVPELARRMADRRFGIGSDGLILICPSERGDAEMRMYNADGSYGEMCGSGIRCVAKYVYDHGIQRKDTLKIESAGRMLSLDLSVVRGKVEQVKVDMGEPILIPAQIPTTLLPPGGPDKPSIDMPMSVDGRDFKVNCVLLGNPHCVVFVEELTDDWVLGIGPKIETDPHFPRRINVEVAKVESRKNLRQRTWERGSGETLACGSGACSVCVTGVLTGRSDRDVTVHLRGGDLSIRWDEATNHVFMTGPAAEVFSGEWLDS